MATSYARCPTCLGLRYVVGGPPSDPQMVPCWFCSAGPLPYLKVMELRDAELAEENAKKREQKLKAKRGGNV